MSQAQSLADQLERAFRGGAWHGPAVAESLADVDETPAALRRFKDRPLAELLAACRQDMEEFLAGAPRGDDLTLLALRRVA